MGEDLAPVLHPAVVLRSCFYCAGWRSGLCSQSTDSQSPQVWAVPAHLVITTPSAEVTGRAGGEGEQGLAEVTLTSMPRQLLTLQFGPCSQVTH